MEQITRDKFPSNGGWKFRQPHFGNWENKMAMVGFDASVKAIISERLKNKAITNKHKLTTNYEAVANELISYNRKIRNIHEAVPAISFVSQYHPDITDESSPRIAGKICITTVFDRHYALAGKTMIKSVLHYTDCAEVDFKVISSDDAVLKEFGPEKCHFVDANIRERYKNVAYSQELPKDQYHTSWYRYEMFNFTGYERVICIDSDCLCIRDISYLFSQELEPFDIVSVEDHIVSKCFTRYVPELQQKGLRFNGLLKRRSEGKIDIQPAIIVANRSILNGEWYRSLLSYANSTSFTYSIDEGILNDFIYLKNLKVKLLPLEYDYQDLYEMHCPELPVPAHPVIVHCQESKPFKKHRDSIDPRMRKWHDRWWYEHNFVAAKTVVVIIVYNRINNLRMWLNAWKQCKKYGSELIVVHNLVPERAEYENLCVENGVKYVPRLNFGFDIGAFQDVCKKRLPGFPNDWANLIWITDDCLPLDKNFVGLFLRTLDAGFIPCYEISDQVKRHVRTTGFMVTKEIAEHLVFPSDPIMSRDDCYEFEHRGFNLYEQLIKMKKKPAMVVQDLKKSPLWDSSWWWSLALMPKHESEFQKH